MKNLKIVLASLCLTGLLFTSCNPDNNQEEQGFESPTIPTSSDFQSIKTEALENHTQTFQFDGNDGNVNLTSENGVQININTTCLTLNGDPVTGTIDLEYVELFKKGGMLTTNKPTMGQLPNEGKALLISGGEFFIEATHNGIPLETTCSIQLIIPTDLTGGADTEMTLWEGIIDDIGNLVWDEVEEEQNQIFVEENTNGDEVSVSYYSFFQSFGWNNVDKFYSDPRPKTTILVDTPDGYDNDNSSVYLSYDGEGSGLATLDTYNTVTGYFSEHYGQIPIGLECHIIFATEDNGDWRYAIKSVTISANEIYTFTLTETTVATESELEVIINNLP